MERKHEKGALIVLLALTLVPMLIFMALAVELFNAYRDAGKRQDVSDLASIAAVRNLLTPGSTVGSIKNMAVETARQNGFTITPGDVKIGEYNPSSSPKFRENNDLFERIEEAFIVEE